MRPRRAGSRNLKSALAAGLHCRRGSRNGTGGAAGARRQASARRLPDPRARDQRLPARVPRLGVEHAEAAAVIDSLVDTYSTATRTCTAASTRWPRRRPTRYEGAREKVRALPRRREHARDHLRARHDRGPEPRRLRLGAQAPQARRRDRRRPRWSTTPTSCRGSSSPTDRRAHALRAGRRRRRARPREPRARRSRRAGAGSSPPCTSRTRSARVNPIEELGALVPRARRGARRRRRTERAASPDRRAGARLRLLRVLGPQARRPPGSARCTAARRCSTRWTRS